MVEDFNIPLLTAYRGFVRKQGEGILSSLLSYASLCADKVSTPALSELYFKRATVSKEELHNIVENDLNYTEMHLKNTSYHEALMVIKEVWPEFGKVIDTCLERVRKRGDEEEFESVADPHRFGEFSYNFKRESLINWIEIIIHEVTHNYIFALTALPDFKKFAGLKELRYSAIRRTERPVIGVFHALCVEANLIKVAQKLKNSEYYSDHNEEIDLLGDRFSDTFVKDFNTLKDLKLHLFDPGLNQSIQEALVLCDGGIHVQ